jgi:UDP-glucose 4-epimerase
MLPDPSARRVLVTGGCGFIGSELARALIKRDYRVTILDDLSTGSIDNLPGTGDIRFFEGSVLDRRDVERAFDEASFVFHLAGVVGMKRATDNPDLTYRVSVEGVRNVLDGSGTAPIMAFSSSAVYGLDVKGEPGMRAVSEETALAYDGGKRGYATGKRDAELFCAAAAERGRSVLVVRPFNTVGPGQKAESGMVIPRLVRQALSGQPLTVFGDGLQKRCFSFVDTVLACILTLTRTPAAWSQGYKAVDIGSRQSTSILDLCRIVQEECGSNCPIEYFPYESVFPGKQDVRVRVPDLTRLTRLIGPVDWPDLRIIVRHYVAEARIGAPSSGGSRGTGAVANGRT